MNRLKKEQNRTHLGKKFHSFLYLICRGIVERRRKRSENGRFQPKKEVFTKKICVHLYLNSKIS